MVFTMVVHIRFFGALKRYATSGMSIEISSSSSIAELREVIKGKLQKDFPGEFNTALLDRAAIADETNILSLQTILNDRTKLSILPPVCGG